MMTYLQFITTIIIGYILGRLHQTPDLKGVLGERIKELKAQYYQRNTKVGAVSTPTQQDIIRRDNPQLKEEEDEMRQAFNQMGVTGNKQDE